MSGRLTLSWANKDKALLSHGEAGYEWVERDDPRVREVRLLDEVGRVGEETSSNLLIRGDSVDALRALVRTPELAAQYRGKVKLVYMDPPFNTGQAFEHYDDSLEHSVWLGMMRERLVLIRELLAPDGSVWVHLDDAEMAYCRVLMDEVFGRQNFVATVVWQKLYARKSNNAAFSPNHDFVTIFARDETVFNRLPVTKEVAARYRNPDNDPRGPWQSVSFSVRTDDPARRSDYRYEIELPSGRRVQPPQGRHWNGKLERFRQLRTDGLLWFGADGDSPPRFKHFVDLGEVGLMPHTIWPRTEVGDNDEAKKEIKALFSAASDVFATPKPERLLERIIHIGSNPGDIVLDCFAGSGTTAAVAHKMGRRWVTVELSESTVDTFTRPRLEKVVAGEDPGGITSTVGWAGGGGFRELRTRPSVWDVIVDDLGTAVFQAPDVDDETMARAVAAQLGYELVDDPVFAGRKGRSRLVVASGVVDAVAVADIVSVLGEGETALIAALSHTDDAVTTLAELSRGSRIVRIPAQLFPSSRAVTR